MKYALLLYSSPEVRERLKGAIISVAAQAAVR
jgi:hypothetical protein